MCQAFNHIRVSEFCLHNRALANYVRLFCHATCCKKQLAGDKQHWVYSFNFWSLWWKEVGNSDKLGIRIKEEGDDVPHFIAGI